MRQKFNPGFEKPTFRYLIHLFEVSREPYLRSSNKLREKPAIFIVLATKTHPSWFFMVQRNPRNQTLSISRESNLHLSTVEKKSTLFVVLSRKTSSSFITLLKMKICDPSLSCIRRIPTLHYQGFEKDRQFVHQDSIRRVASIYLCTEN